jgi:selenocysteine-specific elongation factor
MRSSDSSSPPMKPARSIVIGTAGHIDHGKTALVRALTGIDTDRLPEEKRRGITIDLGFAAMDLATPDGSPIRISFVDVPGHALFIRNMLAGAGCVPAVMLVIAANEGVMPQTREHLAICDLLGMSDGITVISKCDMVTASRLQELRNHIAAFLKGTFLSGEQNSVLGASAHSGAGLDAVRVELAKLAMRCRVAESTRPMRLPLDRTFVKKGFGTVVTGTLLSGEIRVGESLVLEPGAHKVRVRGLQTHGDAEDIARAGTRAAVNLSGVEASEISRGETLIVPGELAPITVIDAEVKLLDGATSLKPRARVHFHAFTSEVMASVSPYGNEPVKAGTTRTVRLKLASPVVLVPGDRFVLRQPLPAGTIGGGRVLDISPSLHERKSLTLAWLGKLATASPSQSLILRVHRRGTSGITMEALAREMAFTVVATRALVEPLVESGEIEMVTNDLLITGENFDALSGLVLTRLKSAGAAGLKRSEIRSQTELPLEILNAAVDRLTVEGKLQLSGDVITLAGSGSPIVNKDAARMHLVEAAYQAAGLAPASVRDVARQLRIPEAEMRRIVTLMLREKAILRMGDDDTFVHSVALKNLSARLASQRGKILDVAAFKALTGLTRKHAIPLLELLDRERVTRKQGDVRIVL